MSDKSPSGADQLRVARYDWPADDDDRFRLTPERIAENERHAAAKVAVRGGRTLRLLVAIPIIIWSFAGIAALILLAIVAIFAAFGQAYVGSGLVDVGLIGFYVLLVLIEIATIWQGKMLLRDDLSTPSWRAVMLLSLVVAVAVSLSLAFSSADSWEWLLVLGAAWYSFAVAVWQWRRSVRLAPAVAFLENYSP